MTLRKNIKRERVAAERPAICHRAGLVMSSVNDEKNKEENPRVNGNDIRFKVISDDSKEIEDTDLRQ